MEDEELEKTVLAYLKRKGFKQAELAIEEEQSLIVASSLPDPTRSRNGGEKYVEGYRLLRTWVHGSLDLYKHEMLRVLYLVFIHSFLNLVREGYMEESRIFFGNFREDHELMHLRDLQKLEGILSPSHKEEMEFTRSLRQRKTSIKLCKYSYDLLLQYLHKTQASTLLGLINEHVNFEVYSGQTLSITDDADVGALVGSSQVIAKQINQNEVRWGLLEDSIEECMKRALSDCEKTNGENKDVDPQDNKKRSADAEKQSAPAKKLKKDKLVGALGRNMISETATVSVAPRVKPELVLPVEVEHSNFEDIRNRVQLNSLALPSVAFYTFINTHNSLNCSSISPDGSLVAGGFSDSSVKVWDMSKMDQPSTTSNLYGENEPSLQGKESCTVFCGHVGPIYSATFSPLGDYLLSSSSDSTIRLWSTKLNANLVCYKGHNYPIWDVQFSPMGHYFASASHDRTARLWSVERVQPLRIMAGHLSDVDCVQWHVNCNYLATGSSDKTVRLWDVLSGECVRMFIGHTSMVLSLALSPDGKFMASGDEDGNIMMWDLSSGRCISPLAGHSSCVWSLAFSNEGTLLASGSADCSIKLWDVTSSSKLSKVEENKGSGASRLGLLKALPTKSTSVYNLKFSRRNLLFAAGALSRNKVSL